MSHLALNAQIHGRVLGEQPYVDWAGGESALAAVLAGLLDARRHYGEPVSRQETTVERFHSLMECWLKETKFLSSLTEIAMHPSYQQIIGLGRPALPLILRELDRAPGHWFWALKAITGVDPVPPQHRGRVQEMARAWRAWASEQSTGL